MTEGIGMFKAYDIRARFGDLPGKAMDTLADAVVRYFLLDAGAGSVVIARDARLFSPSLMDKLIGRFLLAGIDVIVDMGESTTCRFYYMCMRHPSSCGVMLTASHNPGAYAGMKLVGRSCQPIAQGCGPSGGIDRIKEYYLSDSGFPVSAERGRFISVRMQDDYADYSMKLAGTSEGALSGLRVFADFLSGTGGPDFIEAFSRAGASLSFSRAVPDGRFPSGDPNPGVESSIAPARRQMLEGGYDIGFCFDGDADRMDLMFPDGSQMIPAMNFSVLAPYLGRGGKCYMDAKSVPPAVARTALRGIEPHLIRNGHSFIKEKLRRNLSLGYSAAVEDTAHYYMAFPCDPADPDKGSVITENTLFFALLSARIMAEHPEDYEAMKAEQKGIFRIREWSVHLDDISSAPVLTEAVEARMRELGAEAVKVMDDGDSLDATLLRFSVPAGIARGERLDGSWCQIAERISRSEDAVVRWDISASSDDLCREMNSVILSVLSENGISLQ